MKRKDEEKPEKIDPLIAKKKKKITRIFSAQQKVEAQKQ